MIEDLLRQGLIKTVPVDKKKIQDVRDLALRDIATARSILANNQDWAYTMLTMQCFRPGGHSCSHKATARMEQTSMFLW
jgi:hypothetical protein